MIDTIRNMDVSVHSNSKGNLLKTECIRNGTRLFVKSGRMHLRDFPGFWGIEPIVEVICSKLGKAMGLVVAEQNLGLLDTQRYNKSIETLVSSSPDFRAGKQLIYLSTLYVEDSNYIDFDYLCRRLSGVDIVNMLAFDLVIMNEDRHNSNIAWLQDDSGELELAPIYDNGYSLLYDDIKGMLKDYKRASKFCMCNSPLYRESFREAERLFSVYSKIYEPTIRFDIDDKTIDDIIADVKTAYDIHKYYVNNLVVPDEWWAQVGKFIKWRLQYVRDIRDNMER